MTAEAALHYCRRQCALFVLIGIALAVRPTFAGSPDSWVPARWQGGPLELQRRAQEKTLDNIMLLAEAAGLGSADLAQIDVRGVAIRDAVFDFESHRTPAPAEAR